MAVVWKKLAFEDDVITKAFIAAKGDIIAATADDAPVIVPVGTDTHVLTADSGVAAGVKWAAAAGGDGATKEFFTPLTYTSGTLQAIGDYPAALLDSNEEFAHIVFVVPHDFNSITEAVIVCIAKDELTDRQFPTNSDYGAVAEAYNTHSESDTATITEATVTHLFEVDISGILASLVAGDFVGIKIQGLGTTAELHVLGIRFKYA